VQADVNAHLMLERVPGFRAPGVRAGGTFESAQIVSVTEVVVPAKVLYCR
jgi:hypothetical protein